MGSCPSQLGPLASRARTSTGLGLRSRDAAADGTVVRAVLAGDRERYAGYAARMLGSVDAAEDAVQDAFIRAYDQLAQCRDPDNFAGWFFLILRNRCFAERRREARIGPTADVESQPIAATERPDGMMEAKERLHALQQALLELTPEQREVFVLKHVEGLSYEEIAARIGGSVPSLKMRMHRAYDRLRELLKDGI